MREPVRESFDTKQSPDSSVLPFSLAGSPGDEGDNLLGPTMRKAYSDKLKEPRWQKKRLKILERDNWACQNCGNTESTLHVHHTYYEANRDPWDYPNKHLITLCETCHSYEYSHRKEFEAELLAAFKKAGLLVDDLSEIINFINMAFGNTRKGYSVPNRLDLVDFIACFCHPKIRRPAIDLYNGWISNKYDYSSCSLEIKDGS